MSKKNSKKNIVQDQLQRQKDQLKQMRKLDTTQLKEQIYKLREQLTHLIKQKIKHEEDIAKGNQKYMKESFDIQKTIKIQEEELVDLQNNCKLLKNTFTDARNTNKQQWKQEYQLLLNKKQAEKDNIIKSITHFQKKIDHLKLFKIRQIEYISILDSLKDKQQINIHSQQKDLQKIRTEHESKRKDLSNTVKREIQTIKEVEVNKLQQKMNREQQIKKQNQIICQEIALCKSQKHLLQKEYQSLVADSSNSCMQTDSLINNQANQTYERSLRVIKLQNKYNKLKEYLNNQISRLDMEIKNVDKHFQDQKKSLQGHINKLQSWLKLKQKDIKKIKACSQMVLNQRSHLESYLLQVFYEHPELNYREQSNINQILRLLFIKINSKKPPQSYKDHIIKTQQSQISSKKSI